MYFSAETETSWTKKERERQEENTVVDPSGNKSSVKDVTWHLEKAVAISFQWIGYRSNTISALEKWLLHNVSLFIFPVFSKPNCFLNELFQQLVQYNKRAKKKPLPWPFLCNFIHWFDCIKCCHVCRTEKNNVGRLGVKSWE